MPKGEHEPDVDPLVTAKREYQEETGQTLPNGEYIDLGKFERKDGKTISVGRFREMSMYRRLSVINLKWSGRPTQVNNNLFRKSTEPAGFYLMKQP